MTIHTTRERRPDGTLGGWVTTDDTADRPAPTEPDRFTVVDPTDPEAMAEWRAGEAAEAVADALDDLDARLAVVQEIAAERRRRSGAGQTALALPSGDAEVDPDTVGFDDAGDCRCVRACGCRSYSLDTDVQEGR